MLGRNSELGSLQKKFGRCFGSLPLAAKPSRRYFTAVWPPGLSRCGVAVINLTRRMSRGGKSTLLCQEYGPLLRWLMRPSPRTRNKGCPCGLRTSAFVGGQTRRQRHRFRFVDAGSLIRFGCTPSIKVVPPRFRRSASAGKLAACLARADQRRSTLLRMSSGKVEVIVVSRAAAGSRGPAPVKAWSAGARQAGMPASS